MRVPHLHNAAAVAALLAVLAAPASAQLPASPTHDRIQQRSYHFEQAGTDVEYSLYVPTAYDAATPTSLIVLLHGLGSRPERVIRYAGLTEFAEQRGYIVVAPTGYNERGWYGSRGTGRASNRGEAANDPDNLGALSEMDVMNVLEMTLAEFNIAPDEVFLAGHSMGGGGTWHLAMKYPDRWAGLGPVAPAIYSSSDGLSAITHLPVIVIMGDDDNLVSVDVTRAWVAKMHELGMKHRYIEIPGGDHSRIITQTPENVRAIFDFFDQVRNDS
ncbi:MAG: alpha/beta hydrolase [Gemmatimonadota bacterium]|nr:alpha/beta hydrolase [Gemmatimonadota bacterium]MDH3424202.1 alpha/beta hydrolase [Gemmatimonadota bacterium]